MGGGPPPIQTLSLRLSHPRGCHCPFTILHRFESSGSKDTRNLTGLCQGITGDREIYQLTGASSLWGKGKKLFFVIWLLLFCLNWRENLIFPPNTSVLIRVYMYYSITALIERSNTKQFLNLIFFFKASKQMSKKDLSRIFLYFM